LSFASASAEGFDELEFCDGGFHGIFYAFDSGLIARCNLRFRIGWRGESGEIEELSKVRVVVAKIG
jgi:hypothetical protein